MNLNSRDDNNLKILVEKCLLLELFHIGKRSDNGDCIFIASDRYLWLLGSDYKENKDTFRRMEEFFEIKFENVTDINSLIENFKKVLYNNDIIIGMLRNGIAEIYDGEVQILQDEIYSTLLRKIKNELNVSEVKFNSKFGPIRDYHPYYHGTSFKYLKSILKEGLRGDTQNSNWPTAVKNDIIGSVSLTSNYKYAMKHAERSSIITKTSPIVIEFKIRESGKIDADRDIKNLYPSRALGKSKSSGIISIKGNVPPQDIKAVIINGNRFDITEVRSKLLNYDE